MRKLKRFLVPALLLFPLLLTSAYATGNHYHRLYIINQCYDDLKVELPGEKNRTGWVAGTPRWTYVFARDQQLVWINLNGRLPDVIIRKDNTPSGASHEQYPNTDNTPPITLSSRDIRDTAEYRDWPFATGRAESWYITTCPKEKPLEEEGNSVRAAIAGETVHEYTFMTTDYPDEAVTLRINGIRVMQARSGKNMKFTFLLSPETRGELEARGRFKPVRIKIGSGMKPKIRKAEKGESIIMEPVPVTPKGAWE